MRLFFKVQKTIYEEKCDKFHEYENHAPKKWFIATALELWMNGTA